ncbi:MAG: cbb3-type cytochrome c oxidase subunit 3 [Sphingobacteriaceae bacterium]|jgi:cbb3-type cytochrome oxidase subunit 3|nr:cbb3-type cytochrome c oxidase subunit 3 [Sphingobacteriaceae bacterium]
MIRESLEAITGVSIYPIISFVLFFTFFTGMLVWVFRQSKADITEISNLPLHDDQPSKS